MSMAALSFIRNIRVTGTQKLVLFVLADMANERGECWPTIETIATVSCLSQRAIKDSLIALEDRKLIAVSRHGRASTYRILTDAEVSDDEKPRSQMHLRSAPDAYQADILPEKTDVKKNVIGTSCTSEVQLPHLRSAPGAYISLINPKEAKVRKKEPQTPTLELVADVVPSGTDLATIEPDYFSIFWAAYPARLSSGQMVKPDKIAAQKAFEKACQKMPPEQIIERVRSFPFQTDKPQFIPGPAVWLNRGSHMAEVAPMGTVSTGGDFSAARRDWGIGTFDMLTTTDQKEITIDA